MQQIRNPLLGEFLDDNAPFNNSSTSCNNKRDESQNAALEITVNVKKGKGKCEMDKCMGIAIDQTDNIDDIYVCDAGNNRIQVYKRNGEHIRSIIFSVLKSPYSISVSSTYILFTCRYNSNFDQLGCMKKNWTSINQVSLINLGTIRRCPIDANDEEVFIGNNRIIDVYVYKDKLKRIRSIKPEIQERANWLTYWFTDLRIEDIKVLGQIIYLLIANAKTNIQAFDQKGYCIKTIKENPNIIIRPISNCIDNKQVAYVIISYMIIELNRNGTQEEENNSITKEMGALTNLAGVAVDSRGGVVLCEDKEEWIIRDYK